MICQKQILFLLKKIGVLLVLTILILFMNRKVYSQEQYLKLKDLRDLGRNFYDKKEYFLSYLFNTTYFCLSKDSTQKYSAGLEAIRSCIATQHINESKFILDKMIQDYPSQSPSLKYYYGYQMLIFNDPEVADFYLRELDGIKTISDRVRFLRSYSKLKTNLPDQALSLLNKVSNEFKYISLVDSLKKILKNDPFYKKKYKFISIPLSVVLPGAGQLYNGFVFDAIQDFGFNLLLGYSSYSSWRYELSLNRGKRNNVIPIISTGAFLLFYITNIYNAFNSTDKANLYSESHYYNDIIDKYIQVFEKPDYFINFQIQL